MKYYLGIDLGGTNIAVGVVDENFNIVGRATRKTAVPRSADSIADDMAGACFDAVKNAGVEIGDIAACGIGSPGAVDTVKGEVAVSENLGFRHTPLVKMLKERVGKEFYIENDANAAAYGEFLAGAGKGTKNFIAITLGTGIGGGIIADGKIFTGGNFGGAELGHTVICTGGNYCNCGRHGCFEAYASATALIKRTKEEMQNHKESIMWALCDGDIQKASGKTPFDAAEKGDITAKQIIKDYQTYLAAGVTNIINIFQPEVLCIGGGVSAQKENLIKPVRDIVYAENYTRNVLPNPKITVAELGNDAGIIGAAMLYKLHE